MNLTLFVKDDNKCTVCIKSTIEKDCQIFDIETAVILMRDKLENILPAQAYLGLVHMML